MSNRRQDAGEDRRKERVEINLVADEETGRGPILRRGRGCTLPFGSLFLIVAVAVAVHSGAVVF